MSRVLSPWSVCLAFALLGATARAAPGAGPVPQEEVASEVTGPRESPADPVAVASEPAPPRPSPDTDVAGLQQAALRPSSRAPSELVTSAEDAFAAALDAAPQVAPQIVTPQLLEVPAEVAAELEPGAAELEQRAAPTVRQIPGPPPRRQTFVQGGDATVMLAAVLSDSRQGTLEPVFGEGGRVQSWKVRASDAVDFFGVCPDDPLASELREPTVGTCTGFIVAPDLVLTAGHCIDAVDHVGNLRVVLDYAREDGTLPRRLGKDQVFSVSVDARSEDARHDWATLRIRGGSFPRRVAPLCRPSDICDGREGVWSIGHPLGMSRRYLAQHRVLRRSESHVVTDLDTYVGSSGSPVFDRHVGRVLGLVVSGRPDFSRGRTGCLQTSVIHRDARFRKREVALRIDALPAEIALRILEWHGGNDRASLGQRR